MPMFYTEAELVAERAKVTSLETFLSEIGATRTPNGWQFDQHQTEAAVKLREQRDVAQEVLLSVGWSLEVSGTWTPPAADLPLHVRGQIHRAPTGADIAQTMADVFNRSPSATDQAKMARPADPDLGRLTVDLPVWERRAEAERLLLNMGWTITTDRQSYTPPVCWLPPTLVHVLEKVAASDSDACTGHMLSPGDVRYLAMGVGAIRSARPTKVFEHVAWLRVDLVGALRDLSTQNTPWATVAQIETIRRAVSLFDLLEAAGDRAGPLAELRVDTSDIPEAGPAWFASAALVKPEDRAAFTVSRTPDPVTVPRAMARMIALPVLDGIALLAVIDRDAPPFAEGTRAAAALGELEQAVESWLDARAGGA